MTDQEILNKIYDILAEEFELEKESLKPETSLFEELELDSLDAVDLILALEKLFGFRADEEEVKKIRTIEDVLNFIKKNATN